MSLYSSTPAPPDALEVVEAIHAAIAASANIVDGSVYLLETEHVYLHEVAGTHPDRYIIVRELSELGGRAESMSLVDDVPVQVVAAISARRPNVRTWLNAIDKRLRTLLVGTVPTVTNSVVHAPLRRDQQMQVYYDAETDEYLGHCLYSITLTHT